MFNKQKKGDVMGRPYVWRKNEWGENEKKYLDEAHPSLGMPDCDMGGISDDPWGSHVAWQQRHHIFIKDVQYEDESNPYSRL